MKAIQKHQVMPLLTNPFLGTIVPYMGTKNANTFRKLQKPLKKPRGSEASSGIADALFSSTQQRLLALLFGQPERSFYARELIALADSGSGAVQREVSRLVQSGLLTVTRIGNQKHYRANPESPVFHEMRGIVIKSFGIADRVRQALLSLEAPVASAFMYGSLATGDTHAGSDMDIMIIADTLTLGDIFAVMQPLETQLGRKINPTLYTPEEFTRRRQSKNPFLAKVLGGALIPLIGDANAAA